MAAGYFQGAAGAFSELREYVSFLNININIFNK